MIDILMIVMAVFPILMIISSLVQFANKRKKYNTAQQTVSSTRYSSQRTRGSVRQGMNRIKTLEDYYKIEKNISFPKK